MSTEGRTAAPPGTARTLPRARPAAGPAPRPAPARARRAPRRPGPAARPAARLAAADTLAAAVTALAAPAPLPFPPAALPAFCLLLALHAARGLYRPTPMTGALDELPRLLGHTAVAWCAACALSPAAGRPVLVPPALLALIAGHAALACLLRAAAHAGRRRATSRRPVPALVVGTGRAGRRVAAALARHPEYGMRPVGLVGPVPQRLPGPGPLPAPLPVLGTPQAVSRAVTRNAVRAAVFARPPDERLVRLFWAHGCAVWLIAAPGPAAGGAREADGHLWGFACRRLDPPPDPRGPRRRAARLAKRALDVAVAAAALLAAAPLLALCALAVRLADGPGVLFRQERVGEDGRPFHILKFRTLRPADDREAATRWNVAGDGRLSPVGRLLRRTSLDELPQLWNVLRGDMSLVGPRPERPYFVERFSRAYPGYADRHRMPAGLTGLAQVSGLRGDTSIEDRARFDNFYIDTWSLWQDVRIMLRTTAACFRFGGS